VLALAALVSKLCSESASDANNSGIYKGWWNFLNWIRAIAEEGAPWQPPLLLIGADMQPYYAASLWAG
jgi:hypothetical protein